LSLALTLVESSARFSPKSGTKTLVLPVEALTLLSYPIVPSR
jgi:hypothetical protein